MKHVELYTNHAGDFVVETSYHTKPGELVASVTHVYETLTEALVAFKELLPEADEATMFGVPAVKTVEV